MEIKGVHYDLTDLCNAGCPQCARTDARGCAPQGWLVRRACSLEEFRRLSPPEFIASLDYAYFCGNLGDPTVVPELVPILRYCWAAQPRLKLRVFTNASVRPPAWWRELAEAAEGRTLRVLAAIDGASQETNRRYRLRTDFARIMENMAAFIGAGGHAEWRMLVFRHNEHEVEAARALAEARGFKGFRAYPSNRFEGAPEFTYEHRDEAFTLAPPIAAYAPKSPTARALAPERLPLLPAVIACEAVRTSEAFIDFMGYLTPCCHVGLRLYAHLRGVDGLDKDRFIEEAFDRFDVRRLNIHEVGFAAARRNLDAFLAHLGPYWADERPLICKIICGKERPAEPAKSTGEALPAFA